MLSISRALITNPSLILLDEAHISEPFRQTLDHVRRYLDPEKWAEQSIGMRPVTVVPMTATPNEQMRQHGVIALENDDRNPKLPLLARLTASKPADLRDAKNVIKEAITLAQSFSDDKPLAVGIIVNRVATAREIHDQLRALQSEPSDKKRKIPRNATIELVIGSMPPIDRDEQAKRLTTLVGTKRPPITEQPSFIVATQCLEVGADYDFDVLITECASLDALRQRFGRLNRAGRNDADGNPVNAQAFIIVDSKSVKSEEEINKTEAAKESAKRDLDPIYGNALARTWNWLNAHATDRVIDFGIDAFQQLLAKHGDSARPSKSLLAPSASLNAPVMLPGYIDLWCQTAPKPVPDPDVSLFIHGPHGGEPDVQVCWRADLIEDDQMTREQWCDVVALLPPTSAECMSVPISRVRRWLADPMGAAEDHGDMLGIAEADDNENGHDRRRTPPSQRVGVQWRGVKRARGNTDATTGLIESPSDLRPGDTLVLPASVGDARDLGHLPDNDETGPKTAGATDVQASRPIPDAADAAFKLARDRAALRLHPSMRPHLPAGDVFDELFDAAVGEEPIGRDEWTTKLKVAADAISDDTDELKRTLEHLARGAISIEHYPDDRGVVLMTRNRISSTTDWFLPTMDEGDDETSRTRRDQPVMLDDHACHVVETVAANLTRLPLAALAANFRAAARLHDLGKADERFQAMLRRTDRTDAWLLTGIVSAHLAKSDGVPTTWAQRNAARERAGLPAGFRHEMLSMQLAEFDRNLTSEAQARDLILHLIAAHHGHARPIAPVVMDEQPPAVEVSGIMLDEDARRRLIPPHRIDSGIAERFWLLTRRFGWWGLTYLEAILRLADQQASAAEDAGKYDNEHADQPAESTA